MTTIKLSPKQKMILDALIRDYLKTDSNGFFIVVPTTERRNGKLRISNKTLKSMEAKGLITFNNEIPSASKQ
jgi:hypothetical protein